LSPLGLRAVPLGEIKFAVSGEGVIRNRFIDDVMQRDLASIELAETRIFI
jgi:hypothetical protein